MAGTFSSQSKIRPGAYVTFKSMPSATLTPGVRGIVAIPMTLAWGDTSNLIEITADDYLNGRIFEKLGMNVGDTAAIPLREIFKNASTALVGRLNTSGVKASKKVNLTATEVTLTARHSGTLGNQIAVACERNASTNALELSITVGGTVVERQVVTRLSSFVANPWVTIEYTGTDDPMFSEFAVADGTLTGGTDGAAPTDSGVANYTAFMQKCSGQIWNVLAVPSNNTTILANVLTYIKGLREDDGKKVQAVVCGYANADYEGIISVEQGYLIGDEVVSVENFAAYVAGMTAGASIVDSNTYKVIEGATGIVNPLSSTLIEQGLSQGKLMLSMRQDRAVVVEKDINTLHTFTTEKSYIFSKNRIIRCLDDIATQVTTLFETGFIGKVNNDESGRTLFRGAVIGYLNNLQTQGAIQNFNSATDITVSAGNDIESVVCGLAVQPIDSMEKLYMTVVVS